MTHQLDADDFFIHRVQQHCAERGLNFFLIEPLWVEAFLERFAKGEIWARVLLNMHSEHHLPEDVFHRLIRAAAAQGTKIIDPLEKALAAFNKATLHPQLVAAGVNVPATVVVQREKAAAFRLSESEKAALGSPFVVKPAMGYGRRGVIMDATSEADLARSVTAWPDEAYLLQRRVVPQWLLGLPAYFRVYYVFGTVWYCWWNCFTDRYRMVTPTEMEEFALTPLRDLVCRIAALTGMNFFSSEIAQTESKEFVVIDYVNDQCHLLTQTANPNMGVPDELVAAIARRLVEGAQELMKDGQ